MWARVHKVDRIRPQPDGRTIILVEDERNAAGMSLHPALSWFNPFHIGSFGSLATGVLLAVFIYWGFDTAVSVNEETKDARKTPGQAAVIATVVLLAIYVLVTTATQAFAGVGSTGLGLSNPTTLTTCSRCSVAPCSARARWAASPCTC